MILLLWQWSYYSDRLSIYKSMWHVLLALLASRVSFSCNEGIESQIIASNAISGHNRKISKSLLCFRIDNHRNCMMAEYSQSAVSYQDFRKLIDKVCIIKWLATNKNQNMSSYKLTFYDESHFYRRYRLQAHQCTLFNYGVSHLKHVENASDLRFDNKVHQNKRQWSGINTIPRPVQDSKWEGNEQHKR